MATTFFGSQIGGASTQPQSYTGSPFQLLRQDIAMAFRFILYTPYIVYPLRPMASGKFSELYPERGNLKSIFLHIVLFTIQLPFLLSIPLWLLFPVFQVAIGVTIFAIINKIICSFLNGSEIEFPSNPIYAEVKEHHKHEQWIFLNGVAVGYGLVQNL